MSRRLRETSPVISRVPECREADFLDMSKAWGIPFKDFNSYRHRPASAIFKERFWKCSIHVEHQITDALSDSSNDYDFRGVHHNCILKLDAASVMNDVMTVIEKIGFLLISSSSHGVIDYQPRKLRCHCSLCHCSWMRV